MEERELSRYYWLNKEIKDLEERIAMLGDGLGAIAYSDSIKGIGGKHESVQEKIAALKDIYMERRVTALEEYIKIEKYISNVEEPEIRTIMRNRYLDLMSWEDIGEKFYCDRTTIAKKVRRYIKENRNK